MKCIICCIAGTYNRHFEYQEKRKKLEIQRLRSKDLYKALDIKHSLINIDKNSSVVV